MRKRSNLLCLLVIVSANVWGKTLVETYPELLQRVATTSGVKWSEWGEAEKQLLQKRMADLADASPNTLSESDQLAFWINAYNSCVMKLVADHLPIEDVAKIQGFRDKLTCKIAGMERTLVDLGGVIRLLYKDPRVHFALWWGTRGGPRLATKPYEGKTLDAMLDEQAKQFVQNSENVSIDRNVKRATLSPIFDWYKRDFGPKDDAMLSFIRKRVDPAEAKYVPQKLSGVKFIAFNWSIDQAK